MNKHKRVKIKTLALNVFVHLTHIYCSFSLFLCEAGNPVDAGANGHVLLDSITPHRGHGGG